MGNLSLLAILATRGGASSTQDGHVGDFDGHIGYASDDFLVGSSSTNHKRNKGDLILLVTDFSYNPSVLICTSPNLSLFAQIPFLFCASKCYSRFRWDD